MLVQESPVNHVASRTLAEEVKRKVRESGLVVWLDAERQYDELVDALAKGAHDFKYPVVALRGSYLDVMLALNLPPSPTSAAKHKSRTAEKTGVS